MNSMKDMQSYQSIIDISHEIALETILDATLKVQNFVLIQGDQQGRIKILEQLFNCAYKKLYPNTHGGIFEPLNKTIGYTHCHYLDGSKFNTFRRNQFWPKFNILTNYIEGLYDRLQPINIQETIHVLHFLSYVKNSYFRKHSAALAFENQDYKHGGIFVRYNDQIVLSADHTGTIREPFAVHNCDLLLESRYNYPIFSSNKQLLVEYLNSRGNEAMKEIIITEKALPSFRHYLKQYAFDFTLGPYQEHIKSEFSNIHFTRGLLEMHENTGYSRNECVTLYQQILNEYIRQDDAFEAVYFISNATYGSEDAAFSTYYKHVREAFRARYGNFVDFSPDVNTILHSPDTIIQSIKNSIGTCPANKALVTIGLHGEADGSATYAGGNFTKEHFQELFDIASHCNKVQLFIMSCRSGTKTDQLHGNIIMTSSNQVSYATYTNYFLESFQKGESLYLAHIYAMLRYHKSILPTSYVSMDGSTKEICPLPEKHMQ